MIEEKIERLSEGYDFIEEAVSMTSEPLSFQDVSEIVITESENTKSPFRILGRLKGCLAPVGGFSRNNRFYPEDHWSRVLENLDVQTRLKGRQMFGMLGHEDARVSDKQIREGLISHIVTKMEIREDANGKPFLYGEMDILDTPAGRILEAMHAGGAGLYVSSRGAGKLLDTPGKTYKTVSPDFFLETWDIVAKPGFLEAKPVFEQVKESANESVNEAEANEEVDEAIIEEDAKDKAVRRNADKNIKRLDKEIKQASKEFDQAYAEKQNDPNINLHPYAEKEGNLRVARDKEIERRASVASESEIESLKSQLNKLAAVVEKVVDDVYEVDEKCCSDDPSEVIHDKAEQIRANETAGTNKKALKGFIAKNKQIAESEQFADFLKLMSETDVSEDVLSDIFHMIFNKENK